MLLASWKSGKLEVICAKSIPGMVLITRTDRPTATLEVNAGVCRRVVDMESRPQAVQWVAAEKVN